MKICFLIGALGIGGGNNVVLQQASYLRRQGMDVRICTIRRRISGSGSWHPALSHVPIFPLEEADDTEFDLVVATLWESCYFLHRIPARRYAYFVQSIESLFFPAHERARRELVEATYAMGLPAVTEASWIREYARERFGSTYLLARNGIRKDIHRSDIPPHSPRPEPRLRVLVEGPLGVPFKQVERTIRLLAPLRRQRLIEVWLLTASDIPNLHPGVDRVFSGIPVTETGGVYASCHLLVKLSLVEGMFGPPLEMFHCGGTAVVHDVTGHDEYIVHGRNALVVPRGDEDGVVRAVQHLAEDRDLLARLTAGALETARTWPDWEEASAVFHDQVKTLAHADSPTREQLRETARKALAQAGCTAEDLLRGEGLRNRIKRLLDPFLPWLRLMRGWLIEARRRVNPDDYRITPPSGGPTRDIPQQEAKRT